MKTSKQQVISTENVKKIQSAGVFAVLVIDQVKHAVPLAKALIDGGVNAIELTLRTPVAMEAAKVIKAEFPQITLGLGTVISIDQVKEAADVGVDFAVAPGCNPRVIVKAMEYGLSFAPGVATPSDIEQAIEQGCRILKYFPAETSGGMRHLSNMAAPYQHLNLKFIPLGGLTIDNASSYLQSPLIIAIGGSWIAKRAQIQAEDWGGITENARHIRSLISKIRN